VGLECSPGHVATMACFRRELNTIGTVDLRLTTQNSSSRIVAAVGLTLRLPSTGPASLHPCLVLHTSRVRPQPVRAAFQPSRNQILTPTKGQSRATSSRAIRTHLRSIRKVCRANPTAVAEDGVGANVDGRGEVANADEAGQPPMPPWMSRSRSSRQFANGFGSATGSGPSRRRFSVAVRRVPLQL
jgi:hypothetical protein